jgi:septal ring factor EnvC (AmiA/AmiB activator)
MSQTETILLVVLGFALASLVALFIGRIAWRMASRLGARRMQRQVPGTLKDLQADRDRLRADYALLSQKLGGHLETVKARMAEQMAEVARSRNRILSLSEDVAARDAKLAEAEAQIATLNARVASLEAEQEAARAAAQAVAETMPAASGLPDPLAARISQLTALSEEISQTPMAPAAPETAPLPGDLAARLAEAEKETAALQQELSRLDSAWAEKLRATGTGSPAVANVVSLAQHLKTLQKDQTG